MHIPFCVRKCAYCDFNSFSGYTDESVREYVDALHKEIQAASPSAGSHTIDTVFFGGGTPTAIPSADEAALLRTVLHHLPVAPDAEITTEANPGTMDVRHLAVLREAGFNRISFGIQSFDAGLLKTLDRIHTADEGRNAVRAARSAGFENVSIDLMFALPRQTEVQWRHTLSEAFALGTEHISLYSLIVEEGTGFHTLYQKGRLPLPDEDLAARMYQIAIDTAESEGYRQYEISNFAKPGRESRHNIHYWNNDQYFGFGCGAVSYLDGDRRMNLKSPKRYADAVQSSHSLIENSEILDRETSMGETMLMGLRLTEVGVGRKNFKNRFQVDPADFYQSAINQHCNAGLLEVTDACVRLTPKGVFLANEVMISFV